MSMIFWLPPVLWMCLITLLSTDLGSAEHTGRFLGPLLRWLFPGATPADLAVAHAAVRKLAHFTEYAVLGGLWFRAWRTGRRLSPGMSAGRALLISVAWALVDEGHQLFVPSRTASLADAAVDAVGAAVAITVALVAGARRLHAERRLLY